MTIDPSASHLADPPGLLADPSAEERRFVLYGVPWKTYVKLNDEQGSYVRMTYLEGTLELMTLSPDHEEYKKIIARLLEAYAEEMDVDLRGHGSTTQRKKGKKRGLEPDESYSLGPSKGAPDLAIEVVVTSPLVDKLDVYRGLGVAEVWVWENATLTVFRLAEQGYQRQERSALLQELDVKHLASFVVIGDNQTRRVKAYRASLHAGRG